MNMAAGVFFAVSGIVLFVISVLQFQEKGFLLNNAYLWASPKEREQMDEKKEMKRPHYRQSGWVFLLLGISFVSYSLYCFLNLRWLFAAFWVLLAVTLIYAVASSVKMEAGK